jgi:hypothetical protein
MLVMGGVAMIMFIVRFACFTIFESPKCKSPQPFERIINLNSIQTSWARAEMPKP